MSNPQDAYRRPATALDVAAGIAREPRGKLAVSADTRDLTPDVIDIFGRMRVLPADWWATTTVPERALFGHRHGIYSIPTVELVDRVAEIIDGREAIEIGAGHGVLADALGIVGTDSMQQLQPRYRAIYEANGLPTVKYGPNVHIAHASRAVRKWRPQVVIACWVTHKYDRRRPADGGNEAGVLWHDILEKCETLVFVGNTYTHRLSPLWTRSYDIEHPPYLYSRNTTGTPDFIGIWSGKGRAR